jgi:hypothetical protein
MRRAGPLVALAAAVITAGCTAGAPTAVRPGARPGPAARAAPAAPVGPAAPASCPVTRPLPHASPPPQLRAIDKFTYYLDGWYGNSALWMGVPVRGVLPAMHPYGTPWAAEWGTKFPWWRAIPGTLTITARRLDGPSAGFQSQVAYQGKYGTAGLTPSGLYWPAPGCWQVTGTIAGRSLTIVAWVRT